MKQQYALILIGAGSAGLTAAVGFSKAGKKVLLVEQTHMGGECTNSGCVPSKALLHRAKEYYSAKHIAGETPATETYRHGALTYVHDTVQRFLADETPETFEQMGIDVIRGEAIFHTKCSIKIDETQYEYKTAVIATGSSPRMIEVPGLSETDILTNQNIFELETIPEKTLIIGAGQIGMEIGQAFSENDRAKTDSQTGGTLIVIARRINGTVLGAHIVGPAAGEILTLFTLAIDEKISLWKLQKLIFAYPTYSLIVRKAADQFVGRQLSNLKTDVLSIIKRNAPKFIAGFFWATLLFSFQYYRVSHGLSYQDVLFNLLEFFTSTVWGPIIYMALYTLRPLVLFPATLLTALSGALFGFWWGIIFTIIGENVSANFAYWIGRFFGKDLKLEDTVVGNFVEGLRKRSFETVLLMRLFYVPFDLTNYGSGIIKAKWSEYFFATFIGIMPGLTTFVTLGAAVDLEEFQMNGLSFDAFDPKFLAFSLVIFIVSLGLSQILKRWKAEM